MTASQSHVVAWQSRSLEKQLVIPQQDFQGVPELLSIPILVVVPLPKQIPVDGKSR
jgi:hypothetical protein